MGGATSHLPAWSGAPPHETYPWLYAPTLASGYELVVWPLMSGALPVEGTVRCWAIVRSDTGEIVADYTTPGGVLAVVHQLPTRDQLRYLQALAQLLDWLGGRGGIRSGAGYYDNATILHEGVHRHVQYIGPFEVVAASGRQLTIASGATDFRHIAAIGGVVGPFDQVQFSTNSAAWGQVVALVERVVSYGTGAGSNVVLELYQTIESAIVSRDGEPVYCTIDREHLPPPWVAIRDLHPLWCVRERMVVGYAEAEAGPIELRRAADGGMGRLAHPRLDEAVGACVRPATVGVRIVHADGSWVDMTAETLDCWECVHGTGETIVSTFDGADLLGVEGDTLVLEYMMETATGSAARGARVLGQDRCKHATASACGQWDYCGRARSSPAPSGLSSFRAACYQWDCDGYEADAAWGYHDLRAALAQLYLDAPLLEDQVSPPPTEVWRLKRHGCPGLAVMLGESPGARHVGGLQRDYPAAIYADGAWRDTSAGDLGMVDFPASSGERSGPLSRGSEQTTALGDDWDATSDDDYGHRQLGEGDRMMVGRRYTETQQVGGRSWGDRARAKSYVTAATRCIHDEGDATTNDSGQVEFTSHASGYATLRVLPLEGSPAEQTIRSAPVAAASADGGNPRLLLEPDNVAINIEWYDTGLTPPDVVTGTVRLGAPGNGLVSCAAQHKLIDAQAAQGYGGTRFEGAVVGDWIKFAGVGGAEADAIEATGFLVVRTEPFGGSRADPRFNGSPGDPPGDWQRPAGFGDGSSGWGFRRGRVVLDDPDSLLRDNAAHLVGATATAVSGGVLVSVAEVRNNDVVLTAGTHYVVDRYSGTITITPAAPRLDGYYRIECEVIDRRGLPQAAAVRDLVRAIEVIEAEWIPVPLTGGPDIVVSAERWHADAFGPAVGGYVLDQQEVDGAAEWMTTEAGDPGSTYYEYHERYGLSDGTPLVSTGLSAALCPDTGETALYPDFGGAWLVNSSIGLPPFLGTPGARAVVLLNGGVGVGARIAPRQWTQIASRQVESVPAMPGGIMRALPDDTTILEALIDVEVDEIEETVITSHKYGYGGALGETIDDTTEVESSTTRFALELWGRRAGGLVVPIGGVGGLSVSASGPTTVDVTSIMRMYLEQIRGREDFIELFWLPGVGGATSFSSFTVPARSGDKKPEYTGCGLDGGGHPVPLAQDPGVLADNDYTDELWQLTMAGLVVDNLRVRVALESSVRDLRQPYNPSTAARRDLRNP